jgi:hypothetical protein
LSTETSKVRVPPVCGPPEEEELVETEDDELEEEEELVLEPIEVVGVEVVLITELVVDVVVPLPRVVA